MFSISLSAPITNKFVLCLATIKYWEVGKICHYFQLMNQKFLNIIFPIQEDVNTYLQHNMNVSLDSLFPSVAWEYHVGTW